MSGLKVSKSYGLLLRNYPSECNKLFIQRLETPPKIFGSSPIVDNKLVTLTSQVKMWTPQQKVYCVLWFMEFKSVTRVQQRVQTQWNVDPPTSKSIHQWDRTLKETGTLLSPQKNWQVSLSFCNRRHC
ncbi:hypothetical protein TNCV_3063361 [Trichonephila clavipes]|nr:hypothetical protein TNCV_3063361 [Trichonephila clavipes]